MPFVNVIDLDPETINDESNDPFDFAEYFNFEDASIETDFALLGELLTTYSVKELRNLKKDTELPWVYQEVEDPAGDYTSRITYSPYELRMLLGYYNVVGDSAAADK